MDDQALATKQELSTLRREAAAAARKQEKSQVDLATTKDLLKAAKAEAKALARSIKKLEEEKIKDAKAHREEVARLAVAAGAGIKPGVENGPPPAYFEDRVATLRETMEAQESEILELQEENGSLASTVERLTLERNTTIAEVNEEWSAKLSGHLRRSSEAMDQKSAQLAGVAEAHALMGANLQAVEAELEEAKTMVAALEIRLQDYAGQAVGGKTLQELTQERDEARSEAEELTQAVGSLEQALRDSHMATERLEVEKVDLEAQIRTLNKHHEAAHLALVQELVETIPTEGAPAILGGAEEVESHTVEHRSYFDVIRGVEEHTLQLTEDLSEELQRRGIVKEELERRTLERKLLESLQAHDETPKAQLNGMAKT